MSGFNINDPYLDPEVANLCLAINQMPDINTTESCCGHNKDPMRIWFTVDDIRSLNTFLWAGCYRWFNLNDFNLLLNTADVERANPKLRILLESKDIGEEAFKKAELLAAKINQFIKDFKYGKPLEPPKQYYNIFVDDTEPTKEQIHSLMDKDAYTEDKDMAQEWADIENERIKDLYRGV
jgi:hypothetical protein